jgi:hypothetical protein
MTGPFVSQNTAIPKHTKVDFKTVQEVPLVPRLWGLCDPQRDQGTEGASR